MATMSGPTTFTDIWNDAFIIYQQQTGRKLQNDPSLKKLKSNDDLLSEIEDQQAAFGSFRGKHGRLWSALSTCLTPLDVLGHTIQDAASSAPFAPAVFAGVFHLVKACQGVSECYDYLEKLFTELEDFANRLREYVRGEMNPSLRKRTAAILAFLLEIIGRSEKIIKTGRFRKFLSASVFGNDKMKEALDRLTALTNGEERLAVALTYSATQQINQTTGRTEQKVDSFGRAIEDVKAAQQTARSEEKIQADDKTIRELLFSPAADKIRDIFNECSAKLVKGSGAWIQEEPLFEAWMKREAPILWVFGGPGAGKSFLATRIISELKIKHSQDPQSSSHVAVAYFYVKADDQHLQDLGNIFKSIALQIATVDPVFKKHILASHQSGDSIISSHSIWKNLLFKFFGDDAYLEHAAFIVIDGLDEAPTKTRKEMLDFLQTLVEIPPGELRPRLQFAILGRPDLREDIHFTGWERSIDVSSQKNRDDIEKYIKENLNKVTVLSQMHQTNQKKAMMFAKEIANTIIQGADGMFLWAKLIMAQIYGKERESEIRKTLSSAPRELDGVIRDVFLRLENDPDVNHQDLNRILAWVTWARRPLLLGELHEILRMPTGEPNHTLKKRLRGKLASIITLSHLQGEDGGLGELERPSSPVEDVPPPDFTSLELDTADEVDASGNTESTGSDGNSTTTSKEPEDSTLLNPQQLEFTTIQVVFGHKRIEDYLVEANFTFNPTRPDLVGVDKQKAELDITLTLLSVLCKVSDADDSEFSLISYASDNFMKHLESIDISRTSDPDKAKILTFLYQLFYDDDCIQVLLKAAEEGDEDEGCETFIKTWFATEHYSQLVRQWLREADELEDENLDRSMREWMTKAGLSAKEFLRPIALSASRTWLAATSDDQRYLGDLPNLQIWILYGYCVIDEDGVPAFNLSDRSMSPDDLGEIGEKELNEMAEIGDIPKTEHWHIGLARVMLNAEDVTPAMKYFQAAVDINPNMWMPMTGIGICLGRPDRFKEALSWMDKAIKSLPQGQESVAEYILFFVTEYKLALGDVDGAVAASEERFRRLNPSGIATAFDHIWMLYRVQRYSATLDIIRDIDEREANNFARSLLVELISEGRDIGDPVGVAATVIGGAAGSEVREFMRKAIDDAVGVTDNGPGGPLPSVLVRLYGGNFYARHLNRLDKSIVYWESALQIIADHSKQYDFIHERDQCMLRLSEAFFQKAVDAKRERVDPGPWVSKLRKVFSQQNSTESKDDEPTIAGWKGYASQLYGIWLRDYASAEERVWRAYFRASVLEGIELLSDDDPTNDQHGYASLARTLLHAGDVDNSLAALSLTLKPLELRQAKEQADKLRLGARHADMESQDPESPSPTTPEVDIPLNALDLNPPEKESDSEAKCDLPSAEPPKVELSLFKDTYWACDGPCSTLHHEYRELHFCLICNDRCFCEKCILLVKPDSNGGNDNSAEHPSLVGGSRVPHRRCSPNHSWAQAYPLSVVPEKIVDMAATVEDGYVKLSQEWLARLKEQWKE